MRYGLFNGWRYSCKRFRASESFRWFFESSCNVCNASTLACLGRLLSNSVPSIWDVSEQMFDLHLCQVSCIIPTRPPPPVSLHVILAFDILKVLRVSSCTFIITDRTSLPLCWSYLGLDCFYSVRQTGQYHHSARDF